MKPWELSILMAEFWMERAIYASCLNSFLQILCSLPENMTFSQYRVLSHYITQQRQLLDTQLPGS